MEYWSGMGVGFRVWRWERVGEDDIKWGRSEPSGL